MDAISSSTPRRSIRVGHSTQTVPRLAGESAALAALAVVDPKLLIVFASFGYDLPDLLSAVVDAAGDVPVIGCSSAAEIGPSGPSGASVVVAGFGGDFDVTVGHATGLAEQPRRTGEQVASALSMFPGRANRFVILLTDTLIGDQREMLRGVYGVVGATVPLVGGGAGDDMRMVTSRQFIGDKILQGAVVAASVGTDGPIGLAVRHGWTSQGDPMMVTGSRGSEVHSLNDRPALDVYLTRHAAPPGIEADPEAFAQFALTRPLAVERRTGSSIRHVVSADPTTRTLTCGGGVPKGAMLWLATGDIDSTIRSADDACRDAVRGIGDTPLLALLVFDCIGRAVMLDDTGRDTYRRVLNRWGSGGSLAGFSTYGEIGRIRGAIDFHNQTVVAMAVG